MDIDRESSSTSLFGISAFPGVRFAEPDVAVAHVTDVDGPWIRIHYTDQVARLDSDAVFFQVQDSDPRDPGSLIELTEQLSGDVVPLFRIRWRDAYYDEKMEYHGQMLDVYSGEMSRLAEALGFQPFEAEELVYEVRRGDDYLRLPQKVHVAEIAARVWMLKSLTLAAQGKIPLRESGFVNTFPEIPPFLTWQQFRERSWLLLRSISPNLFCGPSRDPVLHLMTQATALEVCALQLYNAVVSDYGLKECATCHRVFHQQRGRAKFADSHRRSDAKYCTPRCAKQPAQKAWRARRKAEMEKGT